jgi:protein SCO1
MRARSESSSARISPRAPSGCRQERGGLPFYVSRELTPEWVRSGEAHRIGDFKLTTNNGSVLNASALDNKISVVHFFFTECNGVCPKTQPNLAWLLVQFPSERRLQILSHSVKPERDSVAALQSYAAEHRITDPRWLLLTGSTAEIEKLAVESYYANLDDGRSYGVNDLAHTETVYLIDSGRHIRGVYNGTLRLDVEQLRDDIRLLARDAASSMATQGH